MTNQQKFEVCGQGLHTYRLDQALFFAGKKAKESRQEVVINADGKKFAVVQRNGKVVLS